MNRQISQKLYSNLDTSTKLWFFADMGTFQNSPLQSWHVEHGHDQLPVLLMGSRNWTPLQESLQSLGVLLLHESLEFVLNIIGSTAAADPGCQCLDIGPGLAPGIWHDIQDLPLGPALGHGSHFAQGSKWVQSFLSLIVFWGCCSISWAFLELVLLLLSDSFGKHV